jgi:hypothetical protein
MSVAMRDRCRTRLSQNATVLLGETRLFMPDPALFAISLPGMSIATLVYCNLGI